MMSMENKIWIKRTAISIAVTSALLSQTAIAEEQQTQQIETVTVTGQQASNLEIKIDQDALEKTQAGDLKDIFKDEAEVSVGGASSVAQKVYVRGLESTMLNVTIDGAKQSSSTFHHQGSISIEPELLKQVEVQAGAGDALSGAGALGGSLSFKTKDPQDLLDAGQRFGALVKGNYSSNANAYKTSLSLYGALNDNWSAMATIVQTEADNYEDGNGNEIEYSKYNQQNGLVKLVGTFDNNQRLSFSYDSRVDDGDKLFRPNWGSANTFPVEMEAHRTTSTVEYSINPTNNKWLSLETNAYYTENNIHRVSDSVDGIVETYGFDIRNTGEFSKHSITYGFDYRNDKSNFEEGSAEKRTDEGDVYGLYLQAKFQLAEAWLLNIGSRYDIYQMTDADDNKFENKGFSPNASLQFTPLDNLQFELGYAQAIRGAQVRESYLLYDGGYSIAADINEERAENIEFSVDYQLNALALFAKVYHSTIDDVIHTGAWDPSSTPNPYYVFDNQGELVTKGVSLGINYNWQALQTSVTYNHNTAELNDEPLGSYDTNLGTSTGDTINTNVNYQFSNSLNAGWSANFVTHLSDTNSEDLEKAGYGVHDIYGQWLPLNDDALKITLSISNLFNKQYRDQATVGETIYGHAGDMAPGRDFKIALAWAL